MREWCRAETYEQVRSAWARLGGLMTLHRYGREHYARMGKRSGEARRMGFLSGMTGVASAALVAVLFLCMDGGVAHAADAVSISEEQAAAYAAVDKHVTGGGYGKGKAYTAAVYLYAATDNDTYAALFYATQRESVRRMLLRVALDACPGKLHEDLSCSPDYEDLMRGEGEGLSAGGGGGGFELEQITHPHLLPAQGWRLNSPLDW